MKCDNCGQETRERVSKERMVTEIKLEWPPIQRKIVKEMWCRRCRYHRLNGAVHWRKRRRYDIEDRSR